MLRDYNIQKESTLFLRLKGQFGSVPIHVKMPSGKLTTLNVLPSDNVENIKEEIYGKHEISPDQQYLIFDGKELEDGHTLRDVNIKKRSMLDLVLHQSIARLDFLADNPDTVRARLRLQIDCEVNQEPRESLEMASMSQELLSGAVLSRSGRRKVEVPWGHGTAENILRLAARKNLQTTDKSRPKTSRGFVSYLEEERKVAIVNFTILPPGSSLIVTVECSSLQKLEELWHDYSTDHLNKMVHKYLVTREILEELAVTKVKLTTKISEEEYRDSRVHILQGLAPKRHMTIFVKTRTGKTIITLDVEPDDTIQNVKRKLTEEIGIPVIQLTLAFNVRQSLTFYEAILRDDSTLRDHNILKGSTLRLSVHVGYIGPLPRLDFRRSLGSGLCSKVYVRMQNGKMITLEGVLEVTVKNVKKKIHQQEAIPVENQCIFFAGKKLKDHITLKDYNIMIESVLSLTRGLQVRLNIRLDCQVVSQPGLQGKSSEIAAPLQERRSRKRRADESAQNVWKLVASKYLQTTDSSNGFVHYLEKVRKVEIADVQQGSLIISVECGSQQILDELWNDYCNGRVNEKAKELVTLDVLKEVGLTEVKLTTNIPEEEYKAYRDQLRLFGSEIERKRNQLLESRNELQDQFRRWKHARKRTRALLTEPERRPPERQPPQDYITPAAKFGFFAGLAAAPFTGGLSLVAAAGGALSGLVTGAVVGAAAQIGAEAGGAVAAAANQPRDDETSAGDAGGTLIRNRIYKVRQAIDKEREESQKLEALKDVLGKCVAEFARFCCEHIHSVLSSSLEEDEFGFLFDILRGTSSHEAAQPQETLLREALNVLRFERLRNILEQLQRSTSDQEASRLAQEIRNELQDPPADGEIQTRLKNFIEATFAEACASPM